MTIAARLPVERAPLIAATLDAILRALLRRAPPPLLRQLVQFIRQWLDAGAAAAAAAASNTAATTPTAAAVPDAPTEASTTSVVAALRRPELRVGVHIAALALRVLSGVGTARLEGLLPRAESLAGHTATMDAAAAKEVLEADLAPGAAPSVRAPAPVFRPLRSARAKAGRRQGRGKEKRNERKGKWTGCQEREEERAETVSAHVFEMSFHASHPFFVGLGGRVNVYHRAASLHCRRGHATPSGSSQPASP